MVSLFLYLVLLGPLVLQLSGQALSDSLEVQVEYLPDDCSYKVQPGDLVKVHYTGQLESGAVFDSSRQAGRQPIAFTLGSGQVIPGWEQGIHGMCKGEKRKLVIPPELAYGPAGHPPVIPGNAKLYFETELVDYSRNSMPFQFSSDQILGYIQFWGVPLAILFLLYKLYKRYQEDTTRTVRKTTTYVKYNKKSKKN